MRIKNFQDAIYKLVAQEVGKKDLTKKNSSTQEVVVRSITVITPTSK